MRPFFLLLPASLLVLASGAGAQQLPYPKQDASPISTVTVTAPAKTVRISEDQAWQIGGSYALSNGWRLKVRPAARYVDATIDNEKPIRLFAVAPYRFATGDGNVTMEFNRGDSGEDMMMSYVPAPGLAQIVVSSGQIAQR